VQAGVEYQLRETFESALVFGYQVLIDLGFTGEQAAKPSRTSGAVTRSGSTCSWPRASRPAAR
jgi:hypothetical protein